MSPVCGEGGGKVAMKIIALGAIMAGIGVALGAFGAHGLKARVSPEMLTIYETAVTYQFYHCFALIVLGLVALRVGDQWVIEDSDLDAVVAHDAPSSSSARSSS